MVLIEHGKVEAGRLVFAEPLPLPEGTEVTVRIELTPIEEETTLAEVDFASLSFFGMWSGREDMEDSAAWVDKERRSWHQRSTRQD